jgi:hypothetical protein
MYKHQDPRVKQRQFATAIPVCAALVGFAAYGCWQLDAPLKISLMVVGLAVLMLLMYVSFYVLAGRQVRKLRNDQDDHGG